jgi:hypothetical protein
MTRIRRTAPLVLLAAVVVLTGCAGGGDESSPGFSQPHGAAPAAADRASSERAPAFDAKAAQPAAAPAKLIRTAEVTVEVDNLLTSAARVRAVAGPLGGSVGSETTNLGGEHADPLSAPAGGSEDGTAERPPSRSVVPGEAVIVLRIPEPSLDQAVSRAEAVGKPLARTATSQDVTGDLADLESRISSQKASLARVRVLMDRATSLTDVVTLESELSRRESDLEALQARRAVLADQAELSTLTVVLRTPSAPTAEPVDGGFLGGLRRGLDALGDSTVVVLMVLGALLPWVVVLLLIGAPIWWLRRRFLARRRPQWAPPAGAGSPGAGPSGGPAGDAGPVPTGAGVGAG